MPTAKVDPRLNRLATLVEQDIRGRGLIAGERYLRTQEVAALLGVSTRLANDAMRILASRQVLTRRPKAGTIVGPAVRADEEEEQRAFDVVHLLIRQDYFLAERDRMESIVTGLTQSLPGVSIQFTFVPAFNELMHAERVVRAAPPGRSAFLIAVKSPQLQRFFAGQSLPVVLFGTPFDGITDLPWIDKDQREIGRLLTHQLVEQGHQRIGVVLRDRRGFGDDLMMDAITHEALAANLGPGSLTVRSVPTERALIDLAMHGLLAPAGRPTAVICRSRLILGSAARVCGELGLRVGLDVTLALCDPQSGPTDVPNFPCLRLVASIDAAAEGRRAGEMLLATSANQAELPAGQLIRVAIPSATA